MAKYEILQVTDEYIDTNIELDDGSTFGQRFHKFELGDDQSEARLDKLVAIAAARQSGSELPGLQTKFQVRGVKEVAKYDPVPDILKAPKP